MQHNAPIQKPYAEDMDPDYERDSDDETTTHPPTALHNPQTTGAMTHAPRTAVTKHGSRQSKVESHDSADHLSSD